MDKFNIIVIDDEINDSWVTSMKVDYPNAIVKCFNSPQDAWSYLEDNKVYKTIVYLDCYYNNVLQGVAALKEIKNKSSLISVVMMSAMDVKQMNEQDIIDIINEEGIFYSKRPNIEDDYKEIIAKIQEKWSTSFDCMLESWLLKSKDENNVVYYSNGKGYTVKEVLDEVRKQSKEGKSIQAAMNLYTINSLLKSKIE